VSDFLNLSTVGLALDIVGVVFLTNSMVVRRPRVFIQQYFGIERPQRLRSVLDQLNAKAQIFTGFVALLVGFSLQIAARIAPSPLATAAAEPSVSFSLRLQAVGVVGLGIVGVIIGLRIVQKAWSLALLRRLLMEFFREHPGWSFTKHPTQTREIGELLAVHPQADDSIGDYADRVRARLKLASGAGDTHTGDDAFAPVRKVGAGRHS
jgi:hypothetical protein